MHRFITTVLGLGMILFLAGCNDSKKGEVAKPLSEEEAKKFEEDLNKARLGERPAKQ